MKFTNNHNLPECWVRALTYDGYSRGEADISVTDLLKSPRQLWLKRRHEDEAETDVSSMAWSLLGSAAHYVADLASTEEMVTEERLFYKHGDITIGGMPDNILPSTSIDDFKITSVWKVIFGEWKDWEFQLNAYRALWYANHEDMINTLRINVLLRDWSAREAQRQNDKGFDSDYPQAPVLSIEMAPQGHPNEFLQKMCERADFLMSFKDVPDDELPFCNDEERWYRGGSYKVYKRGQKRAMPGGVHEEFRDAKEFADRTKEVKPDLKLEVKHIPGQSNACNYCLGAAFCKQRESLKEQTEEVVLEL